MHRCTNSLTRTTYTHTHTSGSYPQDDVWVTAPFGSTSYRVSLLCSSKDSLPNQAVRSKHYGMRPSGPSPATATRALGYRPSTPLSRRTARALHTRIAIRKAMRCAARRRVGTNRRSVTLSVDHDETISVITVAMTLGRLSVLEQFE